MTDKSTILDYEKTIREEQRRAQRQSITKFLQYVAGKLLVLFFTIVIAVYLTVLIANMGGYVDEIKRGVIREQASIGVSLDPTLRDLPTDERLAYIDAQVKIQEERLGLDRPFFIRSFGYLSDALTLDLGFAENLTSDSGSKQVRLIILERLPSTLLLLGVSNFFLFIGSIFFGLRLARRHGGWTDKLIQAFVPTSAAPGWFYGIFLILLFPVLLKVLPFGGIVSAPPPEDPIAYALSVARHSILPVTAILLSSLFISIYTNRTFFMIFASENYVELAKAKGVPDRMIEQKYILRPTLPTIITNLAFTIIGLWTGSLFLEVVFSWPGTGELISRALGAFDTPIIIGTTVIYAYMLGITVFLLDFFYALVDPRIRVGEGSK